MRPLIVLEGKTDELIVSRVLDSDPRLKGRYVTAVGGGRSSAISLARSYLLTGDQHVALVLDAETTDSQRLAQDQSLLEELLGAVASPDRFLVKQVRPEIEAVLFTDKNVATEAFRHEFSDAEWLAARQSPKAELARLLGGTFTRTEDLSRLKRLLNAMNLHPLAGTEVFKEIGDFILRPSSDRVLATG